MITSTLAYFLLWIGAWLVLEGSLRLVRELARAALRAVVWALRALGMIFVLGVLVGLWIIFLLG